MKHIPIDDTELPVALRCEYLTDPLGVDVLQPGMSWRIASDWLTAKLPELAAG